MLFVTLNYIIMCVFYIFVSFYNFFCSLVFWFYFCKTFFFRYIYKFLLKRRGKNNCISTITKKSCNLFFSHIELILNYLEKKFPPYLGKIIVIYFFVIHRKYFSIIPLNATPFIYDVRILFFSSSLDIDF